MGILKVWRALKSPLLQIRTAALKWSRYEGLIGPEVDTVRAALGTTGIHLEDGVCRWPVAYTMGKCERNR